MISRFAGLIGSARRWRWRLTQSIIFRRLKQVALGVVSIAFAILGTAIAVSARGANDRLMGITCAVFFGGGYATMLLIRSVNRGPRAAPSVPLRIDKHSRKQIDRLELHADPRRIVILLGATLFFAAGAATIFFTTRGIADSLAGVIALGLAVCGLLGGAVLVVNRRPPIVLDLESLTYRQPFRHPICIRYCDIAALNIYSVSSQRFVRIQPTNVDIALAAAATARQRRELASAMRWFGTPYVLPNTVAPSAEQLIELISTYIDADRGHDCIEQHNNDERQRFTSLPTAADAKPGMNATKSRGDEDELYTT